MKVAKGGGEGNDKYRSGKSHGEKQDLIIIKNQLNARRRVY